MSQTNRLKKLMFTLLMSTILLLSCTSRAVACKIESISGINFGAYNPLSSIDIKSNGSAKISDCQSSRSRVTISLSIGSNGGGYNPRTLSNGSDKLNYNLYTRASRRTVWGDGSQGTSVVSRRFFRDINLTIYGTLPARQDAAVGFYHDVVVMTVIF